MTKFSANLGFLWQELSLPDAIHSAARAGFDAVECHFPYDTLPEDVTSALRETGLQMLALNTHPGNREAGEFGLLALPGRQKNAREAIDEAIQYAAATGTISIHAMAGIAEGEEADELFFENISYACSNARSAGITILIEPINQRDAPGYFLRSTQQAEQIITKVGAPNLKLMFDCYHVEIIEGDVVSRLKNLQSIIGHVQIASVPDRHEPDLGEVDYRSVFEALKEIGWQKPVGAEYKPRTTTDEGLAWMKKLTV